MRNTKIVGDTTILKTENIYVLIYDHCDTAHCGSYDVTSRQCQIYIVLQERQWVGLLIIQNPRNPIVKL